ncbi:hypothetical protein Hokovirus_1_162 [Hokovirus HKV1]|uniref:Uncharacterized protein n=1 Tax=Hokovirus HKV1 TaxID=1977638 RepID=A0A1V0SEY7_9VIRU|nr:hypothetical protein Hokovirus_1_162 [Hokovirus HKV1]
MYFENFKGDPDFDKLLLNIGLVKKETIQKDKFFLFYFVCIVIRFILYYNVYLFRNNKYLPYIILILCSFAFVNLSYGILYKTNEQWWSKKFQLIISLLLIIISLLLIFNIINNTSLIPIILFISLFGGILQSIKKN